jgi:transketolase
MLASLVAGDELARMADERDDIVVLTADLMLSNRTSDFHARHPDRFFNVGIAEQNMMSMAAGLATCGLIPYVSTFASFAALLCAEHLRTDLAYPQLPVRVLAHHAGIAMGFYGTSHHATEDIAITRSIAGMTVVAPCDANSTRAVLRATVDTPGPVYVRLGRGREREVHAAPPELATGEPIPVRDGDDVTLVATGIGVRAALQAADLLAAEGVAARVLDTLWLKPLAADPILEAAGTGLVVTVEEHNVVGGLGGAVAEVLSEAGARARLVRHGLRDLYADVAPPTHLYRHYGLSGEGVADVVRRALA